MSGRGAKGRAVVVDDDVRVPAGWYPDPLGLPQLRWWDNHAWTEHTSDARQPMVAEQSAAMSQPVGGQTLGGQTLGGQAAAGPGWGPAQPQRAPSRAAEPRLAFADDLPFADDLADIEDTAYPEPLTPESRYAETRSAGPDAAPLTGATELPSRRTMRAAERLAHEDDVVRDLVGDSARFGEPLTALEAPTRGDAVDADAASPAARYAAAARLDDAPRSMRYDLDEVHEDLLGEPVARRSSFAHASSSTATFVPETPEAQPEPRSADVGTSRRLARSTAPQTSTVPSWILTLIPIYVLLVGMILLLGGTTAEFAPITAALLLGVPWVAGIGIAALDRRMLTQGGMERPAHWAWALAGAPVYLVARLVATVREAGNGFGPVLTYLVLGLFMVGAVVAVPGLAMELSPATFAAEAERSVEDDAASFGTELTVDCPDTPPMLLQQSFVCEATAEDGDTFSIVVSLQRSNGWIDWRVDDWGVFTLG